MSRQPKMNGTQNNFDKLVKEVFNFTDTDHDGLLSSNETITALRSLGIVLEDSDITPIVKSFNISDFISLVESLKRANKVWSLPAGHTEHLKSLRAAFDSFDVLKKGEIDREKLHEIFCAIGAPPLTEAELTSLFQTKSTVTFEQFAAALTCQSS